MSEDSIVRRKADHLEICATEAVGFRDGSTLLSEVELVHDALPELDFAALDTSTEVLGHRLDAPLLIASMSGGTPEAIELNQALAALAERFRIGMALGSQRVLLEPGRHPEGFFLRAQAPTTLLLGNLGAVQAVRRSTAELMDRIVVPCGLDGLCLHLNPAQELIQPGGDRDFRGCEAGIGRIVGELPVPVIVKETGCGLSREVGERLMRAGVTWVDVSGAGGTSWVGVESLRAAGRAQRLGELFWDWGVPTAASLCQLSGLPLKTIATGGIRHGLDVARALVLGAELVGIARPLLLAWARGGAAALEELLLDLLAGLRLAMFLTGSATLQGLRSRRWLAGTTLSRWLLPGSPVAIRAGVR